MHRDASAPIATRRKDQPGGFWFVWRIPALLALLTMVGLLTALFSEGYWLLLACGLLGAPLPVSLGYWLHSVRTGRARI